MNLGVVFGKWICRKVPFFKNFELPQNELGKFLYVFEKADYPRKDNSNYPYSFFSNLLPLLISAIGKLNKINILFENRRVFGVLLCGKIKKPWDMGDLPISQGLIFFCWTLINFIFFRIIMFVLYITISLYFLISRDFPVISFGCSIPISSIRVGAMSARHPPSLNV